VGTFAAALVVAAGAVVPFAVPSASADPLGRCTTTVGTIVAADFSHWGGPLVRGCGVGAPNGYALLHAAGFTTEGDAHDGPAFICRLGNQAFHGGTLFPTPATEECKVTPSAAAYWSYWTAPAGQSTWSYSARGATSDVPKPGAVELWVFGGTDTGGTTGSGVPTFGPDALRAKNTAPTGVAAGGAKSPTTGAPVTPTTVGPGQAGSDSPANDPASSPTSAVSRGATHTSSTSQPVATTPSSVTGSGVDRAAPSTNAGLRGSATPQVVDALPAAHEQSSAGSAVPLLVTVGLLAVLGAGGGATMWRRRRLG
jgi:hypothetical protein